MTCSSLQTTTYSNFKTLLGMISSQFLCFYLHSLSCYFSWISSSLKSSPSTNLVLYLAKVLLWKVCPRLIELALRCPNTSISGFSDSVSLEIFYYLIFYYSFKPWDHFLSSTKPEPVLNHSCASFFFFLRWTTNFVFDLFMIQ